MNLGDLGVFGACVYLAQSGPEEMSPFACNVRACGRTIAREATCKRKTQHQPKLFFKRPGPQFFD
jgi:hypothetical protein